MTTEICPFTTSSQVKNTDQLWNMIQVKMLVKPTVTSVFGENNSI